MEDYTVSQKIQHIVFLKNELNELEKFIAEMNEPNSRTSILIINKRKLFNDSFFKSDRVLNATQSAMLYRFLKQEAQNIKEQIEKYTPDEQELADDYINRRYDKYSSILY